MKGNESSNPTQNGKMDAAIVAQPGVLRVERVPIPQPGANQVLVRLQGCGVCASNLPPWEGRPWFQYPLAPGQLGHEGWGTVTRIGPQVSQFQVGDRVAMLSNHAYAQYDVADQDQVLKLPAALDREPFPGEPLGCAINIFNRSGIEAGQQVAIIGLGFLGCLLTQLAKRAGAEVIGISRREFALRSAGRCGADHTLDLADRGQVIEQVRQITDGRFCPVVIEATGKQEPLDLAGELTAERGRLVVAGYHQDGLRQINMQVWNWRGLDVINAHERDCQKYVEGMRAAVHAVLEGRIDPAGLYTHRYPLGELDEALHATANRPDGFMKALIDMGSGSS